MKNIFDEALLDGSIIGYRDIFAQDPGTCVYLLPTAETFFNLSNWCKDNGLRPLKLPYGRMHGILFTSGKTHDKIPNVLFNPMIFVEPQKLQFQIVKYKDRRGNDRRGLILHVFDERIINMAQRMHTKYKVRFQGSVAVAVADNLPTGWCLPFRRPNFSIGFKGYEVGGVN